jgi:hypothetical protein
MKSVTSSTTVFRHRDVPPGMVYLIDGAYTIDVLRPLLGNDHALPFGLYVHTSDRRSDDEIRFGFIKAMQ